MILGDFSVDSTVLQGGPVIQDSYSDPNTGLGLIAPYFTMGLFYASTVLNMIIMLNLLIAIISESFATINQEKTQTYFQDICDLIAENTYLVPLGAQRDFCPKNRYLLIGIDIQQEQADQSKDNISQLKDVQVKISEANANAEKAVTEALEKYQRMNEGNIVNAFYDIIEEEKEILKDLKFVSDPRKFQKDEE
jgi:hypothetical protein